MSHIYALLHAYAPPNRLMHDIALSVVTL